MTIDLSPVAGMPPGTIVVHGDLIVRCLTHPDGVEWRSQRNILFRPADIVRFLADGATVEHCGRCASGTECHAHVLGVRR